VLLAQHLERRRWQCAVREIGKWHELIVKVEGNEISATVDGKSVGSLKSAGIAHPTKQMLRLSVPRNAVVDDVKIWCKK
jgi:hypothetical protein